jgi:hypothetical protein
MFASPAVGGWVSWVPFVYGTILLSQKRFEAQQHLKESCSRQQFAASKIIRIFLIDFDKNTSLKVKWFNDLLVSITVRFQVSLLYTEI